MNQQAGQSLVIERGFWPKGAGLRLREGDRTKLSTRTAGPSWILLQAPSTEINGRLVALEQDRQLLIEGGELVVIVKSDDQVLPEAIGKEGQVTGEPASFRLDEFALQTQALFSVFADMLPVVRVGASSVGQFSAQELPGVGIPILAKDESAVFFNQRMDSPWV